MIKYPLTIVLILLIALQTFSKWALIVEYKVNKDYIASTLCVNRAKPASCCAGKCYLNKKMSDDESQQQAPGKSGQRDETTLQINPVKDLVPQTVLIEEIALHSTRYLGGSTQEHLLTPFQPPQA